jgi:hypothetical protein
LARSHIHDAYAVRIGPGKVHDALTIDRNLASRWENGASIAEIHRFGFTPAGAPTEDALLLGATLGIVLAPHRSSTIIVVRQRVDAAAIARDFAARAVEFARAIYADFTKIACSARLITLTDTPSAAKIDVTRRVDALATASDFSVVTYERRQTSARSIATSTTGALATHAIASRPAIARAIAAHPIRNFFGIFDIFGTTLSAKLLVVLPSTRVCISATRELATGHQQRRRAEKHRKQRPMASESETPHLRSVPSLHSASSWFKPKS